MIAVNEGSQIVIEAIPLDSDGIPITPSAMRYRIDCLTTGIEVLGWTDIASPSETNTITIVGSLNAIIRNANPRERKQMVVETTADGVRNDTVDWEVRNIFGVRLA